ncbi:mucin-5AC [Exaiptasia diaphana]|uniref:Uncharacterized protein n=1 Tax=Exaiptasia diaphana TaxID=2652724 RepID=A0A913X3I5_EXADI|nr:mucin-5AC [Exaiptasia diaphana]
MVVPSRSVENRYIETNLREICALESEISYLTCYGKWEQSFTNGNNAFELDDMAPLHLEYKDTDTFNSYSPDIYGRVVKLNVRCPSHPSDGNNQRRLCFLLKVKGKQNCKVVLPTTSKPTATTQLASSTTSSTSSSTSSSTTLSNEETMASSTTAAEKAITPSSQELTTTQPRIDISSSISKDTTNSPQKTGGKSASTNDTSGGAIGGAIGAVAALVIIVAILIVALRRKKRNSQANKRESVARITDDPLYNNAMPNNEQLEFPDDDEYSYAYTNNHPIVIKDQNGKAVTGSNVANGHNRNINGVLGSPPNQQAPVYSTLEDPNYAKLQKSANTSNGPSYNTLERPENQWTTKQGPVYDVLQDPNTLPNKNGPIYSTLKDPNEPSYNTLERPENKWMTKQGPVYDVLEDSNSTGGPVYSVLEAPNSNDKQVYDALEGQDPNVYGSLDSPDPHVYGALYSPTSKSAPAYDNDIYDSAGGTIIDEDTYQELNQTDQRSSDIYQPVRPPRNTMAMKNMSGITQSQA